MNAKRLLALLAAGSTAATLLSACATTTTATTATTTSAAPAAEETTEAAAAETSTGEKTKITMVTYLGNPTRDALIQEIVSQLDDVELEIISPPNDEAQQKIQAMLQAGEGIDIIELDSVPVTYISNGFIAPLNDYIADWDEWDSVSEFLKEQLVSYDGNTYTVPYGVYERGLFYRKDWLEENNIAVPTTWDELVEACEKLNDPSQNRYGYSFRGGSGTGGYMQMTALDFIDPSIIDIADPFITTDCKSMWANSGAVDALDFYQKLYDTCSPPDSISWGYPEMVEAFYSGVTAFLIQDPEVVATCEEYMEDGTWDVAPLPLGPYGTTYFPAGFAGWGIANCSENKDAAWEVIKCLSSVENNTYFCKQNGNIPIHTTAQSDSFFSEGHYAAWIQMGADPEHYLAYVDGGERRYATDEENEILDEYYNSVNDIVQQKLMGTYTSQECADKLAGYYTWTETSDWVKARNGQ